MSENPQRAAHQVRRARALINALDAWFLEGGHDSAPGNVYGLAMRLPHAKWVEFAQTYSTVFARRPPSPTTVAMAVEMLRSRWEADETYHRRTGGNFRVLVGGQG